MSPRGSASLRWLGLGDPVTTKPLTVANIRSAKPGDVLRDADLPGLHLRVFPGKAVYYLYYRSPTERKPSGKPVERRLRLGTTASTNLPEIRARARSCLAEVDKGRDPAMAKRQRAAEPTFDALFDLACQYHWSAEKFVRSGWEKQVRKIYERDIKPTFGGRRVSDPLDDVEDWHATYADRPFLGNRALAVLSTMLSLAETKKFGRLRPLNANPCTTVKKHPEHGRDVFATPEQISAVGPLISKHAARYPRQAAFLYLLIYSGSRPSAIARATWDQLTEVKINGQPWGLLRPPGKTGRDDIWLPPQAMAVIGELPRTTGTITGVASARKLWDLVRKEAGCPHLRVRDWRRTFATVGMSGGQAMAQISEALNHKTTQTTKRYAKLMDQAKQGVVGQIANDLERLLG